MSATNWVEETLAFNTHSMNYDECSSTSKQVNQFNKFISTWLDLFHASVKPFRVIWSNRSTSFQVFDVIISQLVPIELVILSYTLVKLFIRSEVEHGNEARNLPVSSNKTAETHCPFVSRWNPNELTFEPISVIHGCSKAHSNRQSSNQWLYWDMAAGFFSLNKVHIVIFSISWVFFLFFFFFLDKI